MRPPSAKAQLLLTVANATQFAACQGFWFYVIDDGRASLFVCLPRWVTLAAKIYGKKVELAKLGQGRRKRLGPSDSWDLRGFDFRQGIEFF